jgi:hypothetical protein
MRRYFDLSDARITILLDVVAGSPAALAPAERIRDELKQVGAIREIESTEYARMTRIYKGGPK